MGQIAGSIRPMKNTSSSISGNTVTKIRHSFFDLFAFAHATGWFIKTLVVRDPKIIFFQSVAFELIEYSLRDTLNNFKECWWDHLIVDVLGCNLIGILLGLYAIKQFKL